VVEPGGCDAVLTADVDGQVIVQGLGYTHDDGLDHSGETLCIPSGTYQHLDFNGLQGSEGRPVRITNCGAGQVVVDGAGLNSTLEAHGSRYLHLTGTGDPSEEHGFLLRNAGAGRMGIDMQQGVSDVEVDHFEIEGPAYAGIAIRNYPYCDAELGRDLFTQYDTRIHHNYVHDVDGEGLYIGPSHYHKESSPTSEGCAGIPEAALRGVQVHHNTVEDVGRDGIQVGGAIEELAIYNNVIRRYALLGDYGHIGGLQINPGSVGRIYANRIESGEGGLPDNAIQFAGGEDGPTYLYNNVLVGSKIPFVALSRMGGLESPVHLLNNTMVSRDGGGMPLYLYCDAERVQEFSVTNNVFTAHEHAGNFLFSDGDGQVWSKIVDSNSANCLINGDQYDNDLDENQQIPGNLYLQDPTEVGFVDFEGGDLHLEGTSEAVARGENLSAIFTEDFDGEDRGDGPYDLGAYRY